MNLIGSKMNWNEPFYTDMTIFQTDTKTQNVLNVNTDYESAGLMEFLENRKINRQSIENENWPKISLKFKKEVWFFIYLDKRCHGRESRENVLNV